MPSANHGRTTLCLGRQMPPQDQDRQGAAGNDNCPALAGPDLVPNSDQHAVSVTHSPTSTAGPSLESSGPTPPNDCPRPPDPSRLACIQRRLKGQGFSSESTALICASWRKGTAKSYQSAWKKWIDWCIKRQVDPCSTSIDNIVNFLTEVYKEGKCHSTLNTYRSAISMSHDKIDGTPVGQHPITCRLLQGMFNARPPKPRHSTIWNVDQVISHIKGGPHSTDLDLKELSRKLVTLFALSNADRASDIHLLDLQYRTYHEDLRSTTRSHLQSFPRMQGHLPSGDFAGL